MLLVILYGKTDVSSSRINVKLTLSMVFVWLVPKTTFFGPDNVDLQVAKLLIHQLISA